MNAHALTFRTGLIACAFLTCGVVAWSQSPGLNPATLRTNAAQFISPIPDQIPGTEKDTPKLISLGEKLYFEKRLSRNNTQSCNTCHPVDGGHAGMDHEPTSPGAFGKRGDRNSPTTFNAALHRTQFWDGRAENVKEQAKGPILNPVEMAMPSESEVLARLQADADYPNWFKAAFGNETNAINYDNVTEAIAAFERTLITRDRFDDFLKGRDGALTGTELRGLDTFLKTGCATCHYGPLLGGNSFRKMGVTKPYAHQADLGRESVTKEEDDRFMFKVPSLRNIAATHPYFHDGKVTSLHEAVRTMADIQLAKQLTPEQEADLVAFLQSLTGKSLQTATGTMKPSNPLPQQTSGQ